MFEYDYSNIGIAIITGIVITYLLNMLFNISMFWVFLIIPATIALFSAIEYCIEILDL